MKTINTKAKSALLALQSEHRDLDAAIDRLQEQTPVDILLLQRLKKRRLWLRDEIQKIRDTMVPDIIA